jgi:hypothetical protein
MIKIFGPNTQGVLRLLSDVSGLHGAQIDAVVTEWKRQPPRARAEAWAAIRHDTTPDEQQGIHIAADLARHDAMAVAVRAGHRDWAFWAAVWDAAAAVAACGRVHDYRYRVLANPLATVLPWVTVCLPDRVDDYGVVGDDGPSRSIR